MRAALALLLLAAPAVADGLDDRAQEVFAAAYADACDGAFLENGDLIEPPERVTMLSPVDWDEAPVPVELWLFRCSIGAYNVQSVLIARTESYGVFPAALARPDLDIVLEDPADLSSDVREVRIAGWSASPFLFNAELDPASGEVRETALWRGMGDAASTAVWRVVNEELRLVRYDVDATYDGEVTPETLVLFD